MLAITSQTSPPIETQKQPRAAVLLLSMAYAILVASMTTPVMIWIVILAACACVVRISFYLRWQTAPLRMRTINLLAILGALALAWFSLSIGLLLSMVNLLVMACAFKLMHIAHEKDVKQLFVTLLFLTACGFIFQQSLVYTGLYVSVALILLVALLQFNAPQQSLKHSIRYVAIQLVQGLPIAILLFLVLPQLPPLWQMPTAKGAKTGLSDSVTPGDIADLSQSSELAFRATFASEIPSPPQRYWRVMTLEQFDGKTWQISPTRKQVNRQYRSLNKQFSPSLAGPTWSYQVIAEPSHQRWLFGLDIAQANSNGNNAIIQGHEYQLLAQRPLVSALSYDVESYYTEPLNHTLLSIDHRINLQLPQSGNSLTQRWVEDKLAELDASAHPRERAEYILAQLRDHFSQQQFRYTLRPDPMPSDPVDRFMFDAQAGFCAHYASTLTYILRLANIPARMVTGYQGGELQASGVMSIYQYDAHAWVEAWYDERGWVRIDPTAWVSPDRIDFGLEQAMRDEGSFLADSPLSLARFKNVALFNNLRLWFAQLDYEWSKWVLGFDANRQDDLLEQLFGRLTPLKLSLIGVTVVLTVGLLLALYIMPQLRKKQGDKLTMIYQKSADLVVEFTGTPRGHLPPSHYFQAVQDKLPNLARTCFSELTQRYQQHHYARPSETRSESEKQFKHLHSKLKRHLQKSR
ncbi:transglutaminase family protein [Alteromonas oceanisediminis]|uniref:transglutaminase family protein n=1 Tax=Alteromonas oceanisediminis TaxID=2836180 RepID=UPI001BDA90B0|nr:DUF3488 and transglutaminase-like domain-containing protein [Alteromonas oceanisediminis]MBT0587312.1 transglutaminase-like domain-containing protein [Alteromonas oceanisediminis]